VRLVGFTIEKYHDARSYEKQITYLPINILTTSYTQISYISG